jgi:general nucleoside transport system permease protein
MSDLGAVLDVALLASTVRLVSPILLAALGGMITERAGIFNVSLEGLMLFGAFAAVVGTAWTDQPAIGVLAAVVAAMVVALLFAFVVVDLRGDAIVAGLAINLFALGATTFLMRAIFGVQGGYYDPTMPGLPEIRIPFVEDIPIVGSLVSGHTILVYVGIAAVVVLQVLLFHHKAGLRTRAVGEDPIAAGSVGVRVRRVRYGAILGCGLLCGLAGAQLSLGLVTQFVEGMTAGRGFIALVAVMFGRAHPVGVLAASLFFGGAYALALRLQGAGIPPQFALMLPYIATIGALVVISARRSMRRRAHGAIEESPPEVEAAA